jgi:hypothetical protein
LYKNIFDLYTETWKGVKKPFQVNPYLQKKYKINQENSADRYISSQPIEYIGENGSKHFNKRKMSELPHCLAQIDESFSLEKACELVFLNYEFIHAKFSCYSLQEIQEDLDKVMNKALNESQELKSNYLQLSMFKQFISMIGNRIEDHPSSLAFQFTSRFVNFYNDKYFRHFIEACDSLSIEHCSFISPYLQQEPPGGYLLTSLDKDNESILRILYIKPLLITYSALKIALYYLKDISPQPVFLFNILLPTVETLLDRFSKKRNDMNAMSRFKSKQKPKIKCILSTGSKVFNQEEGIDNSMTIMDSSILHNPDLVPLLFLVIHKHYLYVIAPNKRIKFVHFTDKEISDAFVLGENSLILVEKKSNYLKVFQNFDLESSRQCSVFLIAEASGVKECFSFSSQYFNGIYLEKIELALMLDNNEIKRLVFEKKMPSLNQEEILNLDDWLLTRLESNDSNEKVSEQQINKFLKVKILDTIKPCGIGDLKLLNPQMSVIKKANVETKFDLLYLSSNDGSLVMIGNSVCKLWKNFTRQPILDMEVGQNFFSLKTEDYFYIVHAFHGNMEKLCKLEMNEKVEAIEILNSDYFLLAKDGVIEMHKLECLNKEHTLKLILSIHSLNRNITDMILIGKLGLNLLIN